MARILITEDDPLMLRMYQKIFTLEHYDVDIATNGEEALDKVKVNKPTLILLDIMMPKMNGLQALERLKSNPDTRSIPVIMLTNLAGQQDAEEALLKGAVKYIVKSEHDPKQVVDMVKEVLAGYTRNAVPEAVAGSSSPVQTSAPVPSSSTIAAPIDPVLQSPSPMQSPTAPVQAPVVSPTSAPVEVIGTPTQATQGVSAVAGSPGAPGAPAENPPSSDNLTK